MRKTIWEELLELWLELTWLGGSYSPEGQSMIISTSRKNNTKEFGENKAERTSAPADILCVVTQIPDGLDSV